MIDETEGFVGGATQGGIKASWKPIAAIKRGLYAGKQTLDSRGGFVPAQAKERESRNGQSVGDKVRMRQAVAKGLLPAEKPATLNLGDWAERAASRLKSWRQLNGLSDMGLNRSGAIKVNQKDFENFSANWFAKTTTSRFSADSDRSPPSSNISSARSSRSLDARSARSSKTEYSRPSAAGSEARRSFSEPGSPVPHEDEAIVHQAREGKVIKAGQVRKIDAAAPSVKIGEAQSVHQAREGKVIKAGQVRKIDAAAPSVKLGEAQSVQMVKARMVDIKKPRSLDEAVAKQSAELPDPGKRVVADKSANHEQDAESKARQSRAELQRGSRGNVYSR